MASPSIPAPILRLPLRGAVEDTSGRGNTPVAREVKMVSDPDFGACASFTTPANITVDALACPPAFTWMAWVKRRADLPNYTTPTLLEFGTNNTWLLFISGKPQLMAQRHGSTTTARVTVRGSEVPWRGRTSP